MVFDQQLNIYSHYTLRTYNARYGMLLEHDTTVDLGNEGGSCHTVQE